MFAYPVFVFVGGRMDPRALPWFYRVQQQIGRRVINPGLAVVLIAGIYLASDLHQWSHFYVQWGLGAVIVIGALEGAVVIPGEGRLSELAERDVEASRGEAVSWSPEYEAQLKRSGAVGSVLVLLIVVTIYLMTVQA